MAPTLRSKSLSGRSHRAKSLPGPTLDSMLSPIKSPRKPTPFTLGRINPSTVSICKACKTPILKTPPPPPTPKLTRPARSPLEAALQTSLLEAHGRAVTIQTAYASASKAYDALGNPDERGPQPTSPTSKPAPEWRHAPYTVEVCEVVGTLYGELGKALNTSRKTVSMLDSLLEAERLRLQAGPSEEEEQRRSEAEWEWLLEQRAKREEAKLKKKRKRNRRC